MSDKKKYRVRDGFNWYGRPAGTVVEVSPEFARESQCLEPVDGEKPKGKKAPKDDAKGADGKVES